MSTTLLFAPKTHKDIKPKQAFKNNHRDEVRKDVSDANRLGIPLLIVTPWRCADRSAVHNVALTKGCKQLKWLKEMYCKECPPGMIVLFKVKNYRATATQPEYSILKVTFVREM